MNKLSKKITGSIFSSQEGYKLVKDDWSKRMQAKEELDCTYHIMYAILMGKDWREGLYDPKDKTKLSPGGNRALSNVCAFINNKYHKDHNKNRYCMVGDVFTPESKEILRGLIGHLKFYYYKGFHLQELGDAYEV